MPKPYTPRDSWSQRAAAEGYRARSVYKLQELDERFSLLKPQMTVLDLGAAPGSFLQYAVKQIGPQGRIIGMDLTHIEPVAENVRTFVMDITDRAAVESTLKHEGMTEVDLVLSDIAPNTSGVKDIDQWRSVELNQAVAAIAGRFLRTGGVCVLKVFRGADFDAFMHDLKNKWADVRMVTVKASRDRSREVYVVMKKRGND